MGFCEQFRTSRIDVARLTVQLDGVGEVTESMLQRLRHNKACAIYDTPSGEIVVAFTDEYALAVLKAECAMRESQKRMREDPTGRLSDIRLAAQHYVDPTRFDPGWANWPHSFGWYRRRTTNDQHL